MFFTFTEQVVKDYRKIDFILHVVHLMCKEWESYLGGSIYKKISLFKTLFKKQSKVDKVMDGF